jgi:dehydrogenase/reductase SDR family protein 13
MAQDTTSLKGRTMLITGANTGIGLATAEVLAARGARLWLGCRSEERARPVLERLRASGGNVELLQLDLADLSSVRAAAARFLATGEPLHVLINNAGLAGKRELTPQGFELAFGTNHLGPFLLTTLLLDRLRGSAPARIVNVASRAHYRVKRMDWDALRKPATTLAAMPEYSVSKLCNVLFTRELARRLEGSGVTTYALHPGVIASDIWREAPALLRSLMKLFMRSNEEGAQTSLKCATAPELAHSNGRYYDADGSEREPSRLAKDDALAAELWARSEAWVREA